MAENINFAPGGSVAAIPGTAGHNTQVPGAASTVGNLSSASQLVERDIDDELFAFHSEDTALMSLMFKARKVSVSSPEVEHYMIDEQRSTLTVAEAVAASSAPQFVLQLESRDQNIPRDYHTLLVKGVDGYAPDGVTRTLGRSLMLYVTGRDAATGHIVVRAINGPKSSAADAYCTTPAIAAGTQLVLLANAMYETQKEVDPDMIVPLPETIYLQKRGMNQIVSDYFDAQRKRIPFGKSVIAEQAILNFKRAGNRTLWAGRKGKLVVSVPKLGEQAVYFTEGLRWQFKRELQHTGQWGIDELIALAKMFYTGEDVPRSATLLAGKNLLESIQRIDFSSHPEIQIIAAQNPLGWAVTRVHTVFGDIDIKREPTLDTLGWSNSGALIGNDRLVHYTYSSQHEFNDRVEGEEATRHGMVVWDGLALKGACHIWIDGEGGAPTEAFRFVMWDNAQAPTGKNLQEGMSYYLVQACPGISQRAQAGTVWTYDGSDWHEYTGLITA